jgi:hypothetical protein
MTSGGVEDVHEVPMVENGFDASGVRLNPVAPSRKIVARAFEDDQIFHYAEIRPKQLCDRQGVPNGNAARDVLFNAQPRGKIGNQLG